MHLLYEILAFSTRYIKLPFSESLILNPSRILYYTEKIL